MTKYTPGEHSCDRCVYWRHAEARDGLCRLLAPWAGDEPNAVAHWVRLRGRKIFAVLFKPRTTSRRGVSFPARSAAIGSMSRVESRRLISPTSCQPGGAVPGIASAIRHAPPRSLASQGALARDARERRMLRGCGKTRAMSAMFHAEGVSDEPSKRGDRKCQFHQCGEHRGPGSFIQTTTR